MGGSRNVTVDAISALLQELDAEKTAMLTPERLSIEIDRLLKDYENKLRRFATLMKDPNKYSNDGKWVEGAGGQPTQEPSSIRVAEKNLNEAATNLWSVLSSASREEDKIRVNGSDSYIKIPDTNLAIFEHRDEWSFEKRYEIKRKAE